MTTKLTTFLRNRNEAVQQPQVQQDSFNYNPVPGQDNVVEVSFYENGQKQSVRLETFSNEQIELFESVKQKVQEYRSMTPKEREVIERSLFSF
jgi:hypothetical protein